VVNPLFFSLYIPGVIDHSAYVAVLLYSAVRSIGWWHCLYCTRVLYIYGSGQAIDYSRHKHRPSKGKCSV